MVLNALKDGSADAPRINIKNDGTYAITLSITLTAGPYVIQGYSSSPGDGGRATFDGGTSLINLINDNGSGSLVIADLILQNNGASSTTDGLFIQGTHSLLLRCVVNNVRGSGFNVAADNLILECEAYTCNKSNTAGSGGFLIASNCWISNCVSHDNTGSNNDGFISATGAINNTFERCISDSNGRNGFTTQPSNEWIVLDQCDAYNNGTDGYTNLNTTVASQVVIKNCNFIKNGGWGINSTITSGRWRGYIMNCGFGSGSQANSSGTTNKTDSIAILNSVTYASGVTPWVDPVNGNFSINLLAAIGAGRGLFTQTATSYGGTVGYPDIGAAQSNSTTQSPAWSGGDFILPTGYIGHAYLYEWAFSSNTSFTLLSGSLPTGLTLTTLSTTTAEIAGTPTAIGAFTFVLRATVGTSTGDATFHITINADPDEGIGGLLGGLRPTC